jgi:hypothetical protein
MKKVVKRIGFSWLLLGLLLCGCERTIEIEYNDSVPRYAIEGWLTPFETIVHVCLTRNMNDTINASDISNAIVTITDDEGNVATIPYDPYLGYGGYYKSRNYGDPGHTYRLDVDVDGHHFSSVSTMYDSPNVTSFRLVYRNMMSERYIFGDIRIQDVPNEINYYYLHVYRNGIPYRSAVLKDDTNPGGELQQLFAFNRVGSGDWDVLREGDELTLEARTIDERSYNYLYAVLQMDNTGTNPPDNFTGGCLGYFSAFCGMAFNIRYYEDQIEEGE